MQTLAPIFILLTGYAPKNWRLGPKWGNCNGFLQCRSLGDSTLNYIGAYFRKLLTVGLDLDEVDKLYVDEYGKPVADTGAYFINWLIFKLINIVIWILMGIKFVINETNKK